jgi:hypothetical protein
MRFDKLPKLLPIVDFEVLSALLSRLRFDIASLGLALQPQVDGVATNIEQLTCLSFLETVQLNWVVVFSKG